MRILLVKLCSVFLLIASFTSAPAFAKLAESEETIELRLPASECSMFGEFTQSKQVSGLPQPLNSSGQFYYHCDLGVVWQTQLPLIETLVFRQSGDAYLIKSDSSEKLQSKQGRVLGALLNGLIGSDNSFIKNQFKVALEPQAADKQQTAYLLTPKKRNLKRALKLIKLYLPSALAATTPIVKIAMLDRKKQWTTIESTRKPIEQTESISDTCAVNISASICDLLLGTNLDQSASENED